MFNDEEITDFDGKTYRVKDFIEHYNIQYSPTILIYETSGKATLKLAGYYTTKKFTMTLDYLFGGYNKKMSLRHYFAQRKKQKNPTSSLIKDELFLKPPYNLDRRKLPAKKPLLVLFVQPDCVNCQKYHEVVLYYDYGFAVSKRTNQI